MPGSSLDLGALPSLDDVEFVEKLGEGLGAGRFKARLGSGATVALLLEDTALIDHDRFAAWGRRLATVDHQGLPRVVRVEDALQPAFVAFDYVDGANLEARLALRGEGLAELDALSMVLQAAAAVRAAHRVGVAHGELDPRSLVLVDRPGGLDGVAVVGWTPPAVDHDFEALARADLKALGSILYVALTGVAPPSSQRLDVDDLEGGGGAFDDILMDWVDVERDLGGLGRPALDALADSGRYADVPAFIDALLPHFRTKVEAHLEHVARDLDADRAFMAEVERQRARLKELEARQRAVREWLHDHARRIERCDAELDRLRERVTALQSIETEMGLLAGQAARPAARLPERFMAFDPRQGWSAPPAGIETDRAPVFEPGYDRRGLDRVSRIDRPSAHPKSPETSRDSGRRAAVQETLRDSLPVIDARPPEPDPAPPPPAVDPPPPPEEIPERPALDESEPTPTAGGSLVGALAVAVVLGVLGAAWLLAGTDGPTPSSGEAPTVQTGNVAPMPEKSAPERPESPAAAEVTPPAAVEKAALPEQPTPEQPAPELAAADPTGAPDAGWNPDETFEPVDVNQGSGLGEPPTGMRPIEAGLVHPGLADAQRETAKARCLTDLTDYPAEWCAERLAPTIEPAGAPRPVGPLFADRLEVSQADYGRCVSAGACEALKLHWDLKTQPATGVTRDMAAAYCAWRDARLPSADEWLYLARGGEQRLYPWGDEAPGEGREARANYGRFTHKGGLPDRADRNKYAAPVDTFGERGESPFGLRDMAGNVREWTATEVDGQGVTMGGGWREAPFELRVTRREPTALDTARNDLGFRCVADPTEAGAERK